MLTIINVMSKVADHARATQTSLYRLARKLSTKTLVGKGAEPIGWARGLEQLGFGGFEVGVFATRREAVQAAAKAIRLTGRPAGLLAWRGAHSWVMSGFQATRDPAVTEDSLVTGVYVEDVWYPLVSSIWGPSEPPDTLYRVRDLKVDYLKWRRPTRRYPGMDGRYVTILPIDPRGAAMTDQPGAEPRKPVCPCGNTTFRQERGKFDSEWGITAHRVLLLICERCAYVLPLRGQHHLDFD
jgi:hypothetical protein